MKPVMFTLKRGLSRKDQEVTFTTIKSLDGVTRAGLLKPDALDAEIARMAYAYVDDDTDLDRFVLKLSRLPEIETASIPSQRRVAG
jgi:hypothetical protein